MDDLLLLHMAINKNIPLLTCEQMELCSLLINNQNLNFFKSYKILGLLEASNLFKCLEIKTNLEFVLKLLPDEKFDNIIENYLNTTDLKKINRIVDIIHEKNLVFIIFESAYDDLHSYLKKKVLLEEFEIKHLFKQIIKIVYQLHKKGIIINDLKLRKFVFYDLKNLKLKLENLDGSTKVVNINNQIFNKKYGSIIYSSPEVIKKKPGELINGVYADCWSLGVILYTLTFGKYPFHHEDLNCLMDKILNSKLEFPINNFSIELLNLIKKLLNKNSIERLNSEQILKNDWIDLNFTSIDNKLNKLKNNLNQKNYFSNDKYLLNDDEILEKNFNILSPKEYYSKISKLIKNIEISREDEKNLLNENLNQQEGLEIKVISYNKES